MSLATSLPGSTDPLDDVRSVAIPSSSDQAVVMLTVTVKCARRRDFTVWPGAAVIVTLGTLLTRIVPLGLGVTSACTSTECWTCACATSVESPSKCSPSARNAALQ